LGGQGAPEFLKTGPDVTSQRYFADRSNELTPVTASRKGIAGCSEAAVKPAVKSWQTRVNSFIKWIPAFAERMK